MDVMIPVTVSTFKFLDSISYSWTQPGLYVAVDISMEDELVMNRMRKLASRV